MYGIHDLPLFIVSGLLLNIAPGPDSLLITTRSAAHGWRAGSAAALGVGAGTFVHILAAAVGLSAVLATSATAFTIVKYVGAAYLLYVGLGMLLRRRTAPAGAAATVSQPYRKVFLQGFLTNALNPKVALFFLAFVPQFIAPDAPSKALAFVVLGCIFNVDSMLWAHLLVAATTFARRRVRFNARAAAWVHRLVGSVFVALSAKLALAGRD